MRLEAVSAVKYNDKVMTPGTIFDATEEDGRVLITYGAAIPFNLEDPSIPLLPPVDSASAATAPDLPPPPAEPPLLAPDRKTTKK